MTIVGMSSRKKTYTQSDLSIIEIKSKVFTLFLCFGWPSSFLVSAAFGLFRIPILFYGFYIIMKTTSYSISIHIILESQTQIISRIFVIVLGKIGSLSVCLCHFALVWKQVWSKSRNDVPMLLFITSHHIILSYL